MQVHYDLLQLHAISDDPGKVGRQFGSDRNIVSPRLGAQEVDGFANDLADFESLSIDGALLELRADPVDGWAAIIQASGCDPTKSSVRPAKSGQT
jgi:hypothetical protein